MKKGGWWEPPDNDPKKSVGKEFVVAIVKTIFRNLFFA